MTYKHCTNLLYTIHTLQILQVRVKQYYLISIYIISKSNIIPVLDFSLDSFCVIIYIHTYLHIWNFQSDIDIRNVILKPKLFLFLFEAQLPFLSITSSLRKFLASFHFSLVHYSTIYLLTIQETGKCMRILGSI